ncbi:hypothetical protein MKX07_006928 [Trichoderma sp. CBMAI-0711]|nr:hypothetical protein MKX07_006928 [Trichoderma sp. CBMAI-0711]
MRHCRKVDRRAFGGHKAERRSSTKRIGGKEKKEKAIDALQKTESEAQERDGEEKEKKIASAQGEGEQLAGDGGAVLLVG